MERLLALASEAVGRLTLLGFLSAIMGVNVLGGGVSATDGVVGLAALEASVFLGALLDLALGSGAVEVLVDVLELVVSLGLVKRLALAAGADLSEATTV